MARKYMAGGWSGVPKGGALERELTGMSDEAKRARRAKRVEQVVGDNMKRVKKGKSPLSIRERARKLEKKAVALRAQAKKVEASGTGNITAAVTYRKAAREAKRRAETLRAGL